MGKPLTENPVIRRLLYWAESRKDIRAMLLTSNRSNPDARLDAFSDYDVLLVVTDVHSYFDDRAYLEAYGKVLVVLKNPINQDDGFDTFGEVTHYEDGTKRYIRNFSSSYGFKKSLLKGIIGVRHSPLASRITPNTRI